jgi:hypothetical protein
VPHRKKKEGSRSGGSLPEQRGDGLLAEFDEGQWVPVHETGQTRVEEDEGVIRLIGAGEEITRGNGGAGGFEMRPREEKWRRWWGPDSARGYGWRWRRPDSSWSGLEASGAWGLGERRGTKASGANVMRGRHANRGGRGADMQASTGILIENEIKF